MKWLVIVVFVVIFVAWGLFYFKYMRVSSNSNNTTTEQGQEQQSYQNVNYSAITSQFTCEDVGGLWRLEEGIMVPLESLDYLCFEQYSDVGQSCTGSEQCQGSCVPVDYNCARWENGSYVKKSPLKLHTLVWSRLLEHPKNKCQSNSTL